MKKERKMEEVKNMQKLYDDDIFKDFQFICNDGTVKAHKCVLITNCEYFKTLFTTNMNKNNTDTATNQIEVDCSINEMELFLKYLYSDSSILYHISVAITDFQTGFNFVNLGTYFLCPKFIEIIISIICSSGLLNKEFEENFSSSFSLLFDIYSLPEPYNWEILNKRIRGLLNGKEKDLAFQTSVFQKLLYGDFMDILLKEDSDKTLKEQSKLIQMVHLIFLDINAKNKDDKMNSELLFDILNHEKCTPTIFTTFWDYINLNNFQNSILVKKGLLSINSLHRLFCIQGFVGLGLGTKEHPKIKPIGISFPIELEVDIPYAILVPNDIEKKTFLRMFHTTCLKNFVADDKRCIYIKDGFLSGMLVIYDENSNLLPIDSYAPIFYSPYKEIYAKYKVFIRI